MGGAAAAACVAAVLAALLAAVPAAAQQVDRGAAAAVRAARRAQIRFERQRVRELPEAPGGGGRCDVRIGRFCYWYDDAEPEPPPEPPGVARAREQLLAALARAAPRAPADGWIAGQRVRYLVEAGRPDSARAVAAACGAAEPGWCDALAGLAAHAAGDAFTADSAFARALAAFDAAERCRWTDLAPLLDGALRARYRRAPCAARDSLNRRLWWLAHPLWSRAGNPLPGEHFARLTMSRLQRQARAPLDPVWGADLHELLVRYGWPTAYTRDRPRAVGAGTAPTVAGHEPRPSYAFFPDAPTLEDPTSAPLAAWALARPDAPTRYAPGLRLMPAEGATAWFRRGDSTLVAAALAPPADSAFAAGWEAALVLARDERTAPVVARGAAAGIAGAARPVVLAATAPWRPTLAGVEVVARTGRAAARLRTGLGAPPPAGPFTLSSILLFEPGDTLPPTLADALPAMRPTTRARRAERLGLLWEVYGAAGDGDGRAPAGTVTLGVERTDAPLARRAAEALRLRRRPAPVTLRWGTPAARRAGIATGAVVLRLADLAPGRYRLTVVVAHGVAAAASSREIVVER